MKTGPDEETVARGHAMGRRLLGERWERVAEGLERLDPELARHVIGWAYGDIYGREGLGLRERELIAVVALTALGLESQLKTHVLAAREVGWSIQELREIILQMALFLGFPSVLLPARILAELEDRPPAGEATIPRT